MKTVTEHLREHALSYAGYFGRNRVPDLDSLRTTEWNAEFEQMMRNRLIMGAFRYGLFEKELDGNHGRDLIGYLQRKIDHYRETGNLEDLVDAANMALLEFTAPTHPKAHWNPGDDEGNHCPVSKVQKNP